MNFLQMIQESAFDDRSTIQMQALPESYDDSTVKHFAFTIWNSVLEHKTSERRINQLFFHYLKCSTLSTAVNNEQKTVEMKTKISVDVF